ncbi:hypothetical protein [Streptomyces deccanensis]|uniref:hypothetical protein n=1 Tax=Streptomyces deccanensis TaxID=424188 RepID=UPI001EFB09B3|nr:hypothetical protein [Streptomyces deccanensis]ULR52201.1 hypothetical protein L3078_24545 [Streptomyces deccanensis]
MLNNIKHNLRRRDFTQGWFWVEVFDAVSDFVRSRSVWVTVGNAGTFLSALAGLVYYWSRPIWFAGYAVIQLACLACQAIALIPVVWPGRDDADFSDLHQSLTVITVCGSWIFGVLPGAFLLMFFDVDTSRPPWAALFFSGMALMMACIAGGITGIFLSAKSTQLRETAGPPGGPDREDSGDSADVDSGGFDVD